MFCPNCGQSVVPNAKFCQSCGAKLAVDVMGDQDIGSRERGVYGSVRASHTSAREPRNIVDWYLSVLKKYAFFRGRARRKEYWMFCLANLIVGFIIDFVDVLITGGYDWPGPIMLLYSLFVFLPGLGVTIRRLHDVNRSGWWIFIIFLPFIGPILFLVFMLQDSYPGDNKYGPNPKFAYRPLV